MNDRAQIAFFATCQLLKSEFQKNFERISKQCGFTYMLRQKKNVSLVGCGKEKITKLTKFAHKGYLSTFLFIKNYYLGHFK